MIIRYATKPNTNGNTYQLEIDHEQKTIKRVILFSAVCLT